MALKIQETAAEQRKKPKDDLTAFGEHLALQGATRNTQKTYLRVVRNWLQKQLTYSPQEFLADIMESRRPSTARLARAALIQFHQFLHGNDSKNPWRDATLVVCGKEDRHMPAEPFLRRVRNAGSLIQARQLMVAKTILFCGLQAEEAALACIGDYDAATARFDVRATGNLSDRAIDLDAEFMSEMNYYLGLIGATSLSQEHPLFFSIRTQLSRRLTREAVFRDCVAACGTNARELRICCAHRWWQQKIGKMEWARRLGYQNDHGSYLALEQLMRTRIPKSAKE